MISIGIILIAILAAIALGFGLLFAITPLIALLVRFAVRVDDWLERGKR